MLYILKTPTKFGINPRSFCQLKILFRTNIRIMILFFGFQYQNYILYIEDTHKILFGSANSYERY